MQLIYRRIWKVYFQMNLQRRHCAIFDLISRLFICLILMERVTLE